MWNDELTLIKKTYDFDEIGNQVASESNKDVFCDVKSISRSEFYNAAATGLKPSLIFVINIFEYDNETKVDYYGKRYNVIKTYRVNSEKIELTCEKVIGNG